MKINICLLLIIVTTSCQVTKEESTIDFRQLEEQFMKENINWSNAAKHKDATYIWSLYKDDAWLGIPGKDYIRGKEAIKENWDNTVALVDDLGFETLSLRGNEDIVYETGLAFTTFTMNDSTMIDTSKYLIVWELDKDGNYKIGADLFNR